MRGHDHKVERFDLTDLVGLSWGGGLGHGFERQGGRSTAESALVNGEIVVTDAQTQDRHRGRVGAADIASSPLRANQEPFGR